MAIDFDGSDDNVVVNADPTIDNFSHSTYGICCYTFCRSDGGGNFGRLFDKRGAGGTPEGWSLNVRDEVGGTVVLNGRAGHTTTTAFMTASDTMTLNEWHFVAMFYNLESTKEVKIYLDGVELSASASANGVGDQTDDSAVDLYIGNRLADDRAYDGLISDVYFIDGLTLAQSEVIRLSKMRYTGLLYSSGLYLPMDGPDDVSADGASIIDYSRNGNNGTGDDGAGNSGLTWKSEELLLYPAIHLPFPVPPLPPVNVGGILHKLKPGIRESLRIGLD
jgi:hypothetical protein